METAVLLLTLGLAIVIFIVVFRRRRLAYARPVPILPRIEVGDPTVARRMMFDHSDDFSNRGVSLFPVDFNGDRHQKRYSINTVPFGPEWRAFRCNLTANILHPSRLGRLRPLQREAIDAMVAGLSAQCRAAGEVVVVRESLLKAILPILVRLCFGDGVSVQEARALQDPLQEFFDELNAARAMAPSRLARLVSWSRWLRFAGTFQRLNALFDPLIERRRRLRSKCGGIIIDCYVDSLLELRLPADDDDDGSKTTTSGKGSKGIHDRPRSLRNDQISSLAWEFLGAGTWSAVSAVEWTLARLVIQPGIQTKLLQEIAGGDDDDVLTEEHLRRFPYLRAVILETLRLHPTVPVVLRDAAAGSEGAQACGATAAMAAGSSLVHFMVSLKDIGRSRDVWTDPDEFIPERFLAGGEGEHVGPIPGSKEIKMMPFGAGRRSCPGAGLAMLHIKMFLAALVREFEWAPLRDGVDLTEENHVFKVMKTPLRARITPRNTK